MATIVVVRVEPAFDAIADTDALQAGSASAGPLTGGSYRVPPFLGKYIYIIYKNFADCQQFLHIFYNIWKKPPA